MTRKISSVPDIAAERRDELDALLVEYADLARKAREERSEANAKTAELRHTVSRMFRDSEVEQKALKQKRDAIAARFTEAWENEFPEVRSAVFPSARVDRATRRSINVTDNRALLEKLKALGRLDIVERGIDERGLVTLSRTGALDDLPEGVIVIKDVHEIRVWRGKEI